MDMPQLSAFREERNRILAADVTGATPAMVSSQIDQIDSKEQLAYALKASYGWPGLADISASFDFSNTTTSARVLLSFTQSYYTIDTDTPASPADFFASSVTSSDVAAKIKAGAPPLYVRSVYYGRRILLAVESAESADVVKAALDASVSVIKAGGGVSVDNENVLSHSTIKALILGGSGSGASQAVTGGFDGIKALLAAEGDYSKDHPGAPLAYRLSYLDNTPATIALSTDYIERTCVARAPMVTHQVLANDVSAMISTNTYIDLPFTTTAAATQVSYQVADRSTSSPDSLITGIVPDSELGYLMNGQSYKAYAPQNGTAPLSGQASVPPGSYHFIAVCNNVIERCQFSYTVEEDY
jgi:thiol-activated cytolysin